MPDRPWFMTQTWHDLLFALWRVDARVLRAIVPQPFAIDRYDGSAWVGVVSFRMTNVAPRGVPNMPGISEFPELNVRTYVRFGDCPGVYFLSLDAGSTLAVMTARTVFNLPYFAASMHVAPIDGGRRIAYDSAREEMDARFRATYGPVGVAFTPRRGSLEYFLTERYCLFHVDHRSRPYRLDIHHPAWPLQPAAADVELNTVAAAAGVRLPPDPPFVHFARRQDMVAWFPAGLERPAVFADR